MIKYLRDKITGRPAVFSPSSNMPLDENMPPIKKTHSQSSLIDVMSISINSNSNDITSQVEKLTAAGGGGGGITSGRRPNYSSSPIIIPKKPTRSNASSQSSSSYTSVADQMSSMSETSLQSRRESDDASNTSLPTLPFTCQRLEHSAARDRISVKNKRRQPIKQKLSTLRETDDYTLDNQNNLFSSTPDEEQSIVVPHIEFKIQQQPLVHLSDLDTTRARLRMSVRPRDHSADNILLTTNQTIPMVSTLTTSIQRSISFKRPQDINGTKLFNRSIFNIKKNDEIETNNFSSRFIGNESISTDISYSNPQTNVNNSISHSSSSSKEHIYDNLDLFKRHKTNITSDILSNDNESSTHMIIQTREHSTPTTTRLRPVTMLIPTNNDKQSGNEFENVFNQLKKRNSIRKVRPNEETISTSPLEESFKPLPSSLPVDEIPTTLPLENESILPMFVSTSKTVEIAPVSQSPNRRKTVGGVQLPASNKIAADDNKPTPTWIDIAKQKQNKFQTVPIEKTPYDETEQQHQQTPSIEPSVVSRKQVPSLLNTTITKESTSTDIRSSRKSMYEPVISRRPSPPIVPTTTQLIERDSIRALKTGNPNRINNLIQFFDK